MGFSGRAGWFVLSGSEVWFCEWLVGFWGVLFGVFCLFVLVCGCSFPIILCYYLSWKAISFPRFIFPLTSQIADVFLCTSGY